MIVLNVQKELIQIVSWEDIVSRPGFNANLDPKTHTLKDVIGSYNFEDAVRCGLSNCHTPHNKGFIAVCTDGQETNVGQICGSSYFGIDFETMSRKHEEDVAEKRDRDNLGVFANRLDQLKKHIQDLRQQEHGADWVYRKLKPFTEGSGEIIEVVRLIKEMRRTGSSELVHVREATEEDVKSMELAQGRSLQRPQVIQERVGTVAGLEALYEENDLLKLLVVDLSENIKLFETLKIDTLTRTQLRHHAKWAGTAQATLERAVSALASARRFLTLENLAPFAQVVSRKAADSFPVFLAHLLDIKPPLVAKTSKVKHKKKRR